MFPLHLNEFNPARRRKFLDRLFPFPSSVPIFPSVFQQISISVEIPFIFYIKEERYSDVMSCKITEPRNLITVPLLHHFTSGAHKIKLLRRSQLLGGAELTLFPCWTVCNGISVYSVHTQFVPFALNENQSPISSSVYRNSNSRIAAVATFTANFRLFLRLYLEQKKLDLFVCRRYAPSNRFAFNVSPCFERDFSGSTISADTPACPRRERPIASNENHFSIDENGWVRRIARN